MLKTFTIPMTTGTRHISIIIPARNEANSLATLLPEIKSAMPGVEIIVINDGPDENTQRLCAAHDTQIVNHPCNMGNGAAVKSGARVAQGEIFVFMDGDGQHDPVDISKLLIPLDHGYDMVVGSRHRSTQASLGRLFANLFYNHFASWIVNRKIEDLTSGFRAVRAARFKEFLYLLPNGFSYPTTITMSFFRAGYSVCYVPIKARKRHGISHINPWRDGIRFLLIIFKIGTLYSPLKLFVPISAAFFLTGLGYYVYTYFTQARFTNMSGLLFTTSIIIFMIGLVSEQITNLMFSRRSDD